MRIIKNIFYALCTIPALCLIVSWLTPNDFNRGGPAVTVQLIIVAIIAITCPPLTILGIVGIIYSKERMMAIIATAIAAMPGIYVLLGIHLSR